MEISSRDSGVHVVSLCGVSAVCRGEMGIRAMGGGDWVLRRKPSVWLPSVWLIL